MRRSFIMDLLLVTAVALLILVALVGMFVPLPKYASITAVLGLTVVASATLAGRFLTRGDRRRSHQAHQTLEIVNRSLPHLRSGLSSDTARAVCAIILAESDAIAVAITDTERILGFEGVGSDHHAVGGRVLTRATHYVLESGEYQVLMSREEVGCEVASCPLAAAIVVPLIVRDRPEGTLKFYFADPDELEETYGDMALGLGRLLSTQLELAELDRQSQLATRMELQALQAQINPHFLFNTINTIASLIRTDPPEARRLLREFASFYRRTLEHREELITLEQELEYTQMYLTFERARFGDRFAVDERIAEAALGIQVPAFIVQPLVENALQHGMRGQGVLHVVVTAEVAGTCLRVRVADDGRGIVADDLPKVFQPGFGRGLGIALGNVDDRLRGHFGPESGLSIESTEGQGTTVTMSIAFDRSDRGACS